MTGPETPARRRVCVCPIRLPSKHRYIVIKKVQVLIRPARGVSQVASLFVLKLDAFRGFAVDSTLERRIRDDMHAPTTRITFPDDS